jgi:hydrogenase maturation factor
MVPDVDVGEYVIIHSGYAIDVIPTDHAVETIRLLGGSRPLTSVPVLG